MSLLILILTSSLNGKFVVYSFHSRHLRNVLTLCTIHSLYISIVYGIYSLHKKRRKKRKVKVKAKVSNPSNSTGLVIPPFQTVFRDPLRMAWCGRCLPPRSLRGCHQGKHHMCFLRPLVSSVCRRCRSGCM